MGEAKSRPLRAYFASLIAAAMSFDRAFPSPNRPRICPVLDTTNVLGTLRMSNSFSEEENPLFTHFVYNYHEPPGIDASMVTYLRPTFNGRWAPPPALTRHSRVCSCRTHE